MLVALLPLLWVFFWAGRLHLLVLAFCHHGKFTGFVQDFDFQTWGFLELITLLCCLCCPLWRGVSWTAMLQPSEHSVVLLEDIECQFQFWKRPSKGAARQVLQQIRDIHSGKC